MNDFQLFWDRPYNKKEAMLLQSGFNNLTIYKPKSKAASNSFNYDVQFPTSTVAIDSTYDWFLQGKKNGRIALWRFEDARPSSSSTQQNQGEVFLKSKKHTSVRTPMVSTSKDGMLTKEANDPVYELKWYPKDNGMFYQVGENSVRIWDTAAMEPVFECPAIQSNVLGQRYKIDVFDDLILYGDQLIDLRTLSSHTQIKSDSKISSNSIFHTEVGLPRSEDAKGISSNVCICTGHLDGFMNTWDLRSLKKPLQRTKIGNGMVNHITGQSVNQLEKNSKSLNISRKSQINDVWVVNNGTTVTKVWENGTTVLSTFKCENIVGSKIEQLYVDQKDQIMYCKDSKKVYIYFYEQLGQTGQENKAASRGDFTAKDSAPKTPNFMQDRQQISYKYWNQLKTPANSNITCMDISGGHHLFGLQNGGIAEWLL
ncbi:hypothetical protein ACO0QE_002735 [Hanseniaspora vineae]